MLVWLLVACGEAEPPPPPPVQAAVVRDAGAPVRISPDGKAIIRELARGNEAFVGRLELAPGASVPAHRDATEEYIVVLEGHGKVTIDGERHAVGPGYAITMPAGSEVSFDNEVQPMVALQVFAGPDPADKYGAWSASEAQGIEDVATHGPFVVRCSGSTCRIEHGGAPVGSEIWHYGGAATVIESLGGPVATPGKAWLVGVHAGDGCPSLYRMLCLVDGEARMTRNFGNCNAPDGLTVKDGVRLHFPGWDLEVVPDRPETTAVLDPMGCTVDTR